MASILKIYDNILVEPHRAGGSSGVVVMRWRRKAQAGVISSMALLKLFHFHCSTARHALMRRFKVFCSGVKRQEAGRTS